MNSESLPLSNSLLSATFLANHNMFGIWDIRIEPLLDNGQLFQACRKYQAEHHRLAERVLVGKLQDKHLFPLFSGVCTW